MATDGIAHQTGRRCDMHIEKHWLQLFADGADGSGATGTDGSPASSDGSGATGTDGLASQKASFEQLLEDPEYRAAYDSRVRDTISRRFKAADAREKTLAPMLEALAMKYNVAQSEDGSYDLDAVAKAVTGDDSVYEEEAYRRGFDSVETFKHVRKLEREHADMQRQEQQRQEQQQRQEFFSRLHRQEEDLKAKYPDFDLKQALKDEGFSRMIQAGCTLEAAYFAINHEKLMTGAMTHAAKQTAESVSRSVQSGQARPRENGASAAPASSMETGSLSKAERERIRARVNRGERVVL